MPITFEMRLDGAWVLKQHEQGCDVWVLADPYHLPVLETRTGVTRASRGILTPEAIPLAGWGVRICQGTPAVEIPAQPLMRGPDPSLVPDLRTLNRTPALRPELVDALPEDIPSCLTTLVRLPAGAIDALPASPAAKYGQALWKFVLHDGTTRYQRLTHLSRYRVVIDQPPVTLVLTRGTREEWVELDSIDDLVEVRLDIGDVSTHSNIDESDGQTVYLDEWRQLHACFAEPTPPRPATDYLADRQASPLGVSDPLCPGGWIPWP